MENLDSKDVWVILTSVVTIASIITRLTPNKWDDNFIAKAVKFFSIAPKAK